MLAIDVAERWVSDGLHNIYRLDVFFGFLACLSKARELEGYDIAGCLRTFEVAWNRSVSGHV